MGEVKEAKKEDIFKPETIASNPWLDPKFNKVDSLGKEPGFKVDDIPERLGLVQQGYNVSSPTYYFTDLEDTPNNYGKNEQFVKTDGIGKLTFDWPYWVKVGSTIYYKKGKVAVGLSAPSVQFHTYGDNILDGAVTINESGRDKDFRVEGDTELNLLFCDASTDRFAIGLNAPVCRVHIRGVECADYAGLNPDTILLLENDDNVVFQMQAATTGEARIVFADDNYNPPAGRIMYNFTDEYMDFVVGRNVLVKFEAVTSLISYHNRIYLNSPGYAALTADSQNADSFLAFEEDAARKWTVGFDYSDSLKFKICEGIMGTNVRIEIEPGVAGLINLYQDVGIRNSQDLRFYDNGNYVGFKAVGLGADQIWVLPNADGAASEFLQTDGGGNLTWAAVSAADEKVKVDTGATADYLGAAGSDGALRVAVPLSYADGGNFVTIGVDGTVLIDGDFASAGIMMTDGAGTYSILPGGEDVATDHNLWLGTGAAASLASGGKYNLFIGENAGNALSTGDYNVFIGYKAGELATGLNNVIIGAQAGLNVAAPTGNCLIGFNAGYSIEDGATNMCLGTAAGFSNVSGNSTVNIGYNAGYNNLADYNVFIGNDSGAANSSGYHNIAIGYRANYLNQGGIDCTVIGYGAMSAGGTTTHWNTVIGASAGLQLEGIRCVLVGMQAGQAGTSQNENTIIGYQAGFYNVTGDNNTILGAYAGFGASAQSNANNTFIGNASGKDVTTGSNNVLLGFKAAENITSGAANVVIGYMAASGLTTAGSQLWIANSNTATPLIYGEFPNTLLQVQAPLHLGADGVRVGALTLWDGAGGNTPGYAKIHSPDGTAWYVFVEDDGTVKVHSGVPTANADGDAIGDQTD